jgi:hypothetical protein
VIAKYPVVKGCEEVEKTLRASNGNCEKIARLAKASGRSMREVTDAMLSDNFACLETASNVLANSKGANELVKKLTQEEESGIIEAEVDGVVYYCKSCRHPLDAHKQMEECPECGAKLDWGFIEPPLGALGWSLVGLAMLLAFTQKRS